MPHILASYEIRPIAGDFCPPVHLQQLRKALVSKEESKRVEEMLKTGADQAADDEAAGRVVEAHEALFER